LTDRTSPTTNQRVLACSGAGLAPMLDEVADVTRMRGAMLVFDDFMIGMEQLCQRIDPQVRSRAPALIA
jgi:pyrimidine oxygenase